MVRTIVPDKAQAELLAGLAARAFTADGAPWSARDMHAYGARPGFFLLVDGTLSRGLLLLQVAADQAEIINLGVAPEHRRTGLGRALLTGAEALSHKHGATRLFLEVAADNAPAQALYTEAGFRKVGQRRAYYHRAGGSRADALVLAKDLGSEGAAD